MANDDDDGRLIRVLRAEVQRLLAEAVSTAQETTAATLRVEREHHDALAALADAHGDELAGLEGLRDADAENFTRALASRDIIGQAKGITMVTMRCTADDAFAMLKIQSQAENRKLIDVATDIVEHVARVASSIGSS